MHGSPLSKYDSKDLWKKYNYRDYKIIGEPYFDVDFNKVFYLTDTGRRWDGEKVSVTKYFLEIQKDYLIYGLRKEEWVNFEKEVEYDAFLAKRKKNTKFAI
jgi:hypothetical protein